MFKVQSIQFWSILMDIISHSILKLTRIILFILKYNLNNMQKYKLGEVLQVYSINVNLKE